MATRQRALRLYRHLRGILHRRRTRPEFPAAGSKPQSMRAHPDSQPLAGPLHPLSDATIASIRLDFARMLDLHPLSRSVLPALALLERALSRPAGAGIERMAGPVLLECCKHLDQVLEQPQPEALWVLRGHLQTVLRSLHPQLRCASHAPRAPVSIEEASLSAFMDLKHEWDRRLEHVSER